MNRTIVAVPLASLLLVAQTAPPPNEEVRVSSHAYSPFRLRAESSLVQVNVVVRDRNGRAVGGLKQANFQLSDQGNARDIVSFSVDARTGSAGIAPVVTAGSEGQSASPAAPAPMRFVAMYFDDFGTPTTDLLFTKNAAKQFIENSLSPNDRVAIVTSSSGRITKDYSDDRKQLTEAIDKVQTHARFSQTDTSPCPRITPYDAYKITILMDEDAIHSAITEMSICGQGLPPASPPRPRMPGKSDRLSPERNLILTQANQIWDQIRIISQNTLAAISKALGELYRMPGARTPGSRVLLLVSSGFLTGTLERERDLVVDQALRAGVVINSLDAKGLAAVTGVRPFGEEPESGGMPPEVIIQDSLNAVDRLEEPSSILANFAVSTGGLYFHHNNGFSQGFRELGAVPETTYILGFRPEESTLDGKYHKLKVRLASPVSNGNSVQARAGYFAVKPALEDAAQAELDRQVVGPAVVKDIPVAVDYQPGIKSASGVTPLHIRMHVDLKGIEFPERNGRHLQKLTFVFALLDKENSIVAASEGIMDLTLGDARFGSLVEEGVNALLTLEAPSGIYLLRTVAIEGVRSKMATRSFVIKVP